MATPRFTGPPGAPKAKPFGTLSATAKKSGAQPPIPTTKPKSPSVGKAFGGKGAPAFTKKGAAAPSMKGFGGKGGKR